MKINIPIYNKVWWECEVNEDGTATMRFMAFDGKENIVIEKHENVKVVYKEEE